MCTRCQCIVLVAEVRMHLQKQHKYKTGGTSGRRQCGQRSGQQHAARVSTTLVPAISTCLLIGCNDLRQTCSCGILVARDLIRQLNTDRPRLMVALRGFVWPAFGAYHCYQLLTPSFLALGRLQKPACQPVAMHLWSSAY